MNKLTHLNEKGEANIVDISSKKPTKRSAIAEGKVYISETALNLIISNNIKKGDVLSIARIAGMISAKKTPRTTSWPTIVECLSAASFGFAFSF